MWPPPPAPFEGGEFVTIVSVSVGEDEESILVVFSENPTAVPDTHGAIACHADLDDSSTNGIGVNHGAFWTLGLDDTLSSSSSGIWTLTTTAGFVFASGKTLAPGQTGELIFP